jgi:TRAP-type C4-dicarboxylate transport system substrate-binding protein
MKQLGFRGAVATAAAVAALTALSMQTRAQGFEMKIGFATINDAQHKSASWFSDEIAKRTGGRIKARVFPASQLGKIPRQIEGIQLGTQEAFVTPPGFFVGINPAFQAPDAPGLFDSFEHQYRTLNHPSVRSKFLSLADHAGVVGNYIWSAGEMALATREPVVKMDDLNGRKIRVLASKMEVAMMRAFGATGVPMPYTEVLPAIQRRVIDGVQSGVVVMGPSKFYTVAKHLTPNAMGYIPSAMWMSKLWLNKLPADLRNEIYSVGQAVQPMAQKWSIDITRAWENELWAKNGGTVHKLSAADRKAMSQRVRALGERHLGGNPKIKPMYDLIKAAAEATR